MTARRGRTDEPPFQEHGTGGSLYPADKDSISEPSRPVCRDIKICQVHVVSLEDEVTIVEQVLKNLNIEVDPIALFLPGRPVQLSACKFSHFLYQSAIMQ